MNKTWKYKRFCEYFLKFKWNQVNSILQVKHHGESILKGLWTKNEIFCNKIFVKHWWIIPWKQKWILLEITMAFFPRHNCELILKKLSTKEQVKLSKIFTLLWNLRNVCLGLHFGRYKIVYLLRGRMDQRSLEHSPPTASVLLDLRESRRIFLKSHV